MYFLDIAEKLKILQMIVIWVYIYSTQQDNNILHKKLMQRNYNLNEQLSTKRANERYTSEIYTNIWKKML